MPSAYHINFDTGLVTVTGHASVPCMEAAQLGQRLLADPDFDPTLPHLVDLRGLMIESTPEELVEFTDFAINHYRPKVKASVAVVVDDSLDRPELAALFRLICRIGQAELFDDYELALKWLMRTEFATQGTANQ